MLIFAKRVGCIAPGGVLGSTHGRTSIESFIPVEDFASQSAHTVGSREPSACPRFDHVRGISSRAQPAPFGIPPIAIEPASNLTNPEDRRQLPAGWGASSNAIQSEPAPAGKPARMKTRQVDADAVDS
jgi:hypothetical protein